MTPTLLKQIESKAAPEDLLVEVFGLLGDRAALGTSGQLAGSAILDMAVGAGLHPRVYTLDTGRLFPETLEYFQTLEKRYGLRIERFTPNKANLDQMIARHGENLFFDSKEKQELCCRLRKVEPNLEALATLDAWVTGLRADQSEHRAGVRRLEMISLDFPEGSRSLLKVCPLADWTEAQVRAYLEEHNVPLHPLLEWEQNGWRYESLGCVICTTPIGPGEPRRAGRWRWFNQSVADDKKECGLHLPYPEPGAS
ncbi:MAG: phosphoadenylyl-sulfate reductase [Candidatus Omnitrophica bacterium]|nr:phosphoadenylyl-sulfate reductase [Candidatus Omnitrophota bacterium]